VARRGPPPLGSQRHDRWSPVGGGTLSRVLDFFSFKSKRRERLRGTPLSDEQRAIVRRKVSYFSRLSDEDRRELEGHMQVFLAEKRFEGCGGLELTDEIKLTIAAQACILLLHRETDYYPGLGSVLVYPSAYVVKQTRQKLGDLVVESEQVRVGESWVRGAVVLAWDAVQRGASDCHDGDNVVFHEFAHQLDAEDGAMNGVPALAQRSLYSAWARALGAEYDELLERVAAHQPGDIDAYGAISPAEFFAVVTVAFFEMGAQLKAKHPDLYEVLRAFYRQDPAGHASFDRPEYAALIGRFVEGVIDGRAFQCEYFAMFKQDPAMGPEAVFQVLDSLFAAADSFVADPELRDEGDLDERQLREKAASALRKLQAITMRG
jgi:MtfA peptidase